MWILYGLLAIVAVAANYLTIGVAITDLPQKEEPHTHGGPEMGY